MNATRATLVVLGLVLFAGTLWLHWPCVEGGFLEVDDKEYLQKAVQWKGLTWEAVKEAFSTSGAYYQPLPRLSHALDYQLWGKNAAGHHATSVFLHALNTALVFGFMWTLLSAVSLTIGERLVMAWGIAVVFAIHPLQVESVAWMSGRTQLLSTMFGIGCVWAYAAGTRRWVVWGLYAAALLCKPTAVSLPFAMLAMDYFPLRRYEQLGWGRLLREKTVLIALAAPVGAATIATEAGLGETVPLSQRVWLTFPRLMFYPWRLVCPVRFSPFYSLRLDPSLGQWPILISAVTLGVITALAVWGWRRLPALAAAWGAYLAFALPVTGLIHGGSAAPRHAYVTMLPLLPLAGGAAVWVWRRSTTVARVALISLLIGELCAFGVLTHSLIPDWHSDETLQRAILAWFPGSEFNNRALALTLLDQGRASEALPYAQRDVQIAPQLCWSHMTLGIAFNQLGRLPDAIEEYEQALRINPNIPEAHYNLGVTFEQAGRMQDAIREVEAALRIKPDYADAHYNLGVAFEQAGRLQEAIAHYEQALHTNPDDAATHNNLGNVLIRVGKTSEAIAQYEQALRIKPDYAKAHNNLGNALIRVGRVPEAIAQYEQTLRTYPDDAEAHYNLGNAWLQEGETQKAIEQYKQALRSRPDWEAARNALAQVGQ